MRLPAAIAISVILQCFNTPAQDATNAVSLATNTSPAVTNEAGKKAWSFSASVSTYIVPDGRDYAQPTITADHDWLHLEARYIMRTWTPLRRGSAVISAAAENWPGKSPPCSAACSATPPASRRVTMAR